MKVAISRWSRATTRTTKVDNGLSKDYKAQKDFEFEPLLRNMKPAISRWSRATTKAAKFPNHLTCRQLQPPKGNDPSITHYLTPSNHPSFFYHLHFNSKQIILSKRLPP
ncbi:hypothetical protein JHK84_049467 [Glycine max]|nr:hypothetical protein JHK85_050192 [Glycine max]KAG5093879.1 hypothetical protein JHK84_049467 [Glycine max]